MATNFTLNSGDRNFDSTDASVLTDGGAVSINNNTLVRIDSDTGYCRNAATPGSITFNSSTGGKCIIDGRDVWWVPFSASTGNVPSFTVFNTLTAPADVQRGGLDVGAWLGFYPAMNAPPVLPGNAIPSSGFLKLRYRSSGVTFANGNVLTFPNSATVTLSGAGQRGWIAVQLEGLTGASNLVTIPRLGDFKVEGDFFELGETQSQQQVNGTDINNTNNKIYFRQNANNNYYIGTIANGNYSTASSFATAVQTAMNAATPQVGTSTALAGTFTVTARPDNRLVITHSTTAFWLQCVGPVSTILLGFDFYDQTSAIHSLIATGTGTGSTSASANQLRVIRNGVGVILTLTNAVAAGSALGTEVNTRLRTLDPRFFCIWDSTNSRINIYHPEAFTIDFTIANHPGAVMGYSTSILPSSVIHRVIGRGTQPASSATNTTSRAFANYLIGINDGVDKVIDIGNLTNQTNLQVATALQTALNTSSSGFTVYVAVSTGGSLVISRSSPFTLKWSAIQPNSAHRAMGFTMDDSVNLQTVIAQGPVNFGATNQTFNYFVKDVCPGIQVETAPGSGVYEWYSYVPRSPTSFFWNSNSVFSTLGRWANTTRAVVGTAGTVSTDSRGKNFSMLTVAPGVTQASTYFAESGVIELARQDGVNDCGYAPPQSGCKVRVPNVHLGSGYGRLVGTFGFDTATDTASSTSITAPATVSNYTVTAGSNNYFPFRENATDKIAVIAAGTYTNLTFPIALSLALNTTSNNFNTFSVSITSNIVTIVATQPFSVNYLSNKAFVQHAAAGSRPEFVTTSAGAVYMKKCATNWYINLSAPFSVLIEDTSTLQQINIANTASTTTLTRVCVSSNYSDSSALVVSSCFTGGTISSSVFNRYLFSSPFIQFIDSANFTVTDTMVGSFGLTPNDARRNTNTTASTNAAIDVTRCTDTSITATKLEYGRINIASSIRTTITNLTYADSVRSNIDPNGPGNVLAISGNSDTILLDGYDAFDGMPFVWCYGDVITCSNYSNLTVRNIGTPSAPLDMQLIPNSLFNGNVGVNTDLRRIYMSNLRSQTPLSLTNAMQNVTMVNIWGVPTSTTFGTTTTNGIDSVNTTAQGCRWTIGSSGQVACYGFHWTDHFISTTSGRLAIFCNEPLDSTADQCAITAGTPLFTSLGIVSMPTLGDQITWTCPYYVLGYTALTNSAPGLTHSAANYTYEYQIDTGSGSYGSWKTLNATNLSGETITATTGFKLKVRATTVTANTANTITKIEIALTTTSTAQQTQYPLPLTGSALVSAISSGSRIQLYNETKNIELVNQVVNATSFTWAYNPAVSAASGDTIRLRLTKLGFLPYQARTIAAATTFGYLAEQVADSVYTTNAIDGSTVSECSPDYTNDKIDIDDVDDTTTVQRLYAFYRFVETQSAGIGDWFNGVLAVNTSTYVVSQSVLNLTYNNVSTDPLRITGGRWTRANGTTIKYVSSNPIWTESVTVNSLQAGSRVQIFNTTTSAELYNAVVAGTSYQFDFSVGTGISTGNTIRIRATLPGRLPFETSGSASATETVFSANQLSDAVYDTNGINGSSVSECTSNFSNNTIALNLSLIHI
jgi:hypothetical protein